MNFKFKVGDIVEIKYMEKSLSIIKSYCKSNFYNCYDLFMVIYNETWYYVHEDALILL